jgi:hypothetical protein
MVTFLKELDNQSIFPFDTREEGAYSTAEDLKEQIYGAQAE